MDQHEYHNISLFSQCHCQDPGYCPIFRRKMGENPPDWNWCKNASYADRKSYFDLLSKAPPSETNKLLKILKQSDNNKEALFTYLTLNDKYHKCEGSTKFQEQKNKKILAYIRDLNKDCNSFDNIEIVVLGHSQKQFDTIEERPYLTKTNLNDINAGKYRDNKWAEARAFVSEDNLFKKNTDFVGLVTASWNTKYEPFCRIDNFHNWDSAKVLLNSKEKDQVVLCADIFCPCIWFMQQSNVLSVFFSGQAHRVGKIFSRMVGLEFHNHMKVPFSNQMILHKNIYYDYVRFLKDNEILDKVQFFIDRFASRYISPDKISAKYAGNRLNGYFIEMVTSFWFAQQDFFYIPNAERREDWYNPYYVEKRMRDKT